MSSFKTGNNSAVEKNDNFKMKDVKENNNETKKLKGTKVHKAIANFAKDYVGYYKAIFARTLFGSHALVAVWRTTVLMGAAYWSLTFGIFILVGEYIVTMWVRTGEEWPWISPSTLCYLATTASSIWVQKLHSLGHIEGVNGSTIATLPSTSMKLDFSAGDWLLLTEQTMMVTIILSRWLLPKGEMAHTELSTLLLLYLGLSADILDFSTIFDQERVAADKTFCFILLVIWTGSLCQFFLVLTNTSKVEEEKVNLKSIICSSDVWQILVQVLLQDFPFLVIRVTVLLSFQVFNYTIIFFVCKNTLVIALEVYHLIAVCKSQTKKLKRRKLRIQRLKNKMTAAKDKIKSQLGAFNMDMLKKKNNLAKAESPEKPAQKSLWPVTKTGDLPNQKTVKLRTPSQENDTTAPHQDMNSRNETKSVDSKTEEVNKVAKKFLFTGGKTLPKTDSTEENSDDLTLSLGGSMRKEDSDLSCPLSPSGVRLSPANNNSMRRDPLQVFNVYGNNFGQERRGTPPVGHMKDKSPFSAFTTSSIFAPKPPSGSGSRQDLSRKETYKTFQDDDSIF